MQLQHSQIYENIYFTQDLRGADGGNPARHGGSVGIFTRPQAALGGISSEVLQGPGREVRTFQLQGNSAAGGKHGCRGCQLKVIKCLIIKR